MLSVVTLVVVLLWPTNGLNIQLHIGELMNLTGVLPKEFANLHSLQEM